ncbi:protein translocase subunit SecD [Sanguibacter suarezii]|uniref:protein translocase subunit SecD n=1 Tax=Sanguibacter suarezii TaxID=60921 RepID=UPI0009FBEDD1|nr:protein translocase subunit SecD [Sanguibacter suarezii]
MATTNHKKSRPSRSLIGLAVIILAIFGSIFAGTKFDDASWTPKLALDLEGGTQIILTPVTENNEKVTSEDIDQAIAIIRQRVDSSGVAEAEITSQGGTNIVVALPGNPSQETLDLVRESAQMQFRPVLYFGAGVGTDPIAPESETDAATGGPTAEPTLEPSAEPSDAATDAATPAPQITDPSDFSQVTPELLAEFDALNCTDPANLAGGGTQNPNEAIVACSADGAMKYILGPMELAGSDIDSASSGLQVNAQGVQLNTWAVSIKFTGEGTKKFTEVTSRLSKLPTYETWIASQPPTQAPGMFAMVLDNLVISAPGVEVVISDGRAEITGNFTRASATTLANQLNFGSLPLTFEVQSESQISATLGSEQLQKGLLAGLIGLLLVVIYSLIQYRALGLVTVASLVIAGVITYGVITLLSWTQGYRLSLPGVTGLIVAIGITADSFIVYFERIRDELRDGRSLTSAVDTGWDRARRTILASDGVNFLAAVVLYFLAVGGVRGFAFTLGLTTIVDVVVVFFFTHPLMKLLAKTKFFGEGHPASGLDPHRLGATSVRYGGRGRVVRVDRESAPAKGAAAGTTKPRKAAKELVGASTRPGAQGGGATAGMTIAERRAARALAEKEASAKEAVAADDATVTEATTPEAPEATEATEASVAPTAEDAAQHDAGDERSADRAETPSDENKDGKL